MKLIDGIGNLEANVVNETGSPYTIVNVKMHSVLLRYGVTALRRFACPVACMVLITCSALGQIKPEEQSIQQAFENFRAHAGLQITQTGTTTVGTTTSQFNILSTWFQDVEDGRPMSKVEIIVKLNGIEVFRAVGDGTTLYEFDEQRNEYSSSRYGNYSGNQPTEYVNALLSSVRSMLKSSAMYPGRLLSEVYGGTDARYTTWLPGATIENTGAIVRYTLGNPVHRSLEFGYSNVPPNVILNSISYFDHVDMPSVSRDINWSMSFTSFDIALTDVNFSFVPPVGARAVVGVRPVTGG